MAMKVFNVNDVLSAADTNEYLVNTKYVEKPAATTRINTTSPANDPDLHISLDTNKVYWLELTAPFTSIPAAGFIFSFAVPAGTVFTGYALTSANAVLSINTYSSAGLLITANVFTSSSGSNVDDLITVRGTLDTAGTAGNITYQWAQHFSNGGNTTVRAGASMYVKRVS